MEVSPINSVSSGSGPSTSMNSDLLQRAVTAVRRLNVGMADREFAVTRDPQTNQYVVVMRDRGTGTILDQFPPEDVLKMLSQLSKLHPKSTEGEDTNG